MPPGKQAPAKAPSLYVFRFETPARRQEILNELEETGFVGEVVENFKTQGTGRLYVALIVNTEGDITHFCRMLRYQGAAFRRISVGLTALEALSDGLPIKLAILEARAKKRKEVVFAQLGRLLKEENERTLAILDRSSPALALMLREKGKASDRMLRLYSEREREIIGLERDCIGLALDIAFEDRNDLVVDADLKAKRKSFLDMLDQTRFIEDEVVAFDKARFPGLERVAEENPRVTVFEHNGERLEIIHANRNELEHTMGVDLIYVSHFFHSFVGIQYKMLEGEGSAVSFSPDDRFLNQLDKMRLFQPRSSLARSGLPQRDYRLNGGAFFFKFVSRLETNFAQDALCPGMYLPHDLAEIVVASPPAKVGYRHHTRHLSNSEFANLFRQGWIGTSGGDMEALRKSIADSIASRRSLTIAVDRRTSPKDRGRRKTSPSLARQLR